jgi:hypothetical protein
MWYVTPLLKILQNQKLILRMERPCYMAIKTTEIYVNFHTEIVYLSHGHDQGHSYIYIYNSDNFEYIHIHIRFLYCIGRRIDKQKTYN